MLNVHCSTSIQNVFTYIICITSPTSFVKRSQAYIPTRDELKEALVALLGKWTVENRGPAQNVWCAYILYSLSYILNDSYSYFGMIVKNIAKDTKDLGVV